MSTNGGTVSLETLQAELGAIKAGQARVEQSLGQIIDLTKHVALLQERADNHRSETAAMDARYAAQLQKVDNAFTDLRHDIKTAVDERERSIKKVHERVDGQQKWIWTVFGGAMLASALMVYAAAGVEKLITEVVRLHDAELRASIRIDRLEKHSDGQPQN